MFGKRMLSLRIGGKNLLHLCSRTRVQGVIVTTTVGSPCLVLQAKFSVMSFFLIE